MLMQHVTEWLALHSEELGALCFVLVGIWRSYRTRQLHAEHLERERQRLTRFAFDQVNETSKTLSTAFAGDSPPTLADLLSHAERDWSLTSSEAGSTPDEDDRQAVTVEAVPHPQHKSIIPPPPRPIPPPRRK